MADPPDREGLVQDPSKSIIGRRRHSLMEDGQDVAVAGNPVGTGLGEGTEHGIFWRTLSVAKRVWMCVISPTSFFPKDPQAA
jgi:hypothetical protein